MKYAVVTSGGKQYKVIEGQVLEIDKIEAESGANYTLDKVLLTVDGDSIHVGTPYLKDTVVIAKVLEQVKGDKIRVAKFKAKARYRKVQGFRAQLTRIKISSLAGKDPTKPSPSAIVAKIKSV